MSEERLYNLLPAVYRNRDERGELRALLGLMETELKRLEEALEDQYDDWFIETCGEWAVPYIGDLFGISGLHPGEAGTFSQRSFVANTIAYRRRKGTAIQLEQMARDATGWNARVVEFFRLLADTENMNHVATRGDTLNLRDGDAADFVDSPFTRGPYTIDLRNTARGARNTMNGIGLFLWPLQTYRLEGVTPRPRPTDPTLRDGRYFFSPIGHERPLFNVPRTETSIEQIADEINLPLQLRPRALREEIETIRTARRQGETPAPVFFASVAPALEIKVAGPADANGNFTYYAIRPEEMIIDDLGDWRRPPATLSFAEYRAAYDVTPPPGTNRPNVVSVDPVRGRFVFADGFDPAHVRVAGATAFSGDVGGGPYNRAPSVTAALPEDLRETSTLLPSNLFHVGVSTGDRAVLNETIHENLSDAIHAWNATPPATPGIICILDSATYDETLPTIEIKAGSSLMIVAAGWPVTGAIPNIRAGERLPGRIVPEGMRPNIRGGLRVRGVAPASSPTPGSFALNGILIEGDIDVLPGHLGRLDLGHSSLADGGALLINANSPGQSPRNEDLQVKIERGILGAITVDEAPVDIDIQDSILYARGTTLEARDSRVATRGVTLFGASFMRRMDAEDSIFLEPALVERVQAGCSRYNYLAPGSKTPRRFRCQPDLALKALGEELDAANTDPAEKATRIELARAGLRPVFDAVAFGDPGFARLSRSCPPEIRAGGENGSEIGVFNFLEEQRRELNLREALGEYLRYGREAGIFFMIPPGQDTFLGP